MRIGNRSEMQMLTSTMSPPPPSPCTARPTISIPVLTATAASSEPTQKTTLASSKIGLRPQMSEILPHSGVEAELASRYALPIQVKAAVDWKCSAMVGAAVVMIVYWQSSQFRVILERKKKVGLSVTENGGLLEAYHVECGEKNGHLQWPC